MATAPSLTRTDRAAGIIVTQECIPQDDGRWVVRDTLTGSGLPHIATLHTCDCRDAQRGNHCKHMIAVAAEEQALSDYAYGWDLSAALQRPRCPQCGCALEERSYYVGGKGYQYVQVCSDDATHSNRRPRIEELPEC